MERCIIFKKARATAIATLMLMSAFIGMTGMVIGSDTSTAPMTVEGRQLTDAEPVTYVQELAWDDSMFVYYWDFGPVVNYTMPLYMLFYSNGTRVVQDPILRYIPGGIFDEVSGDPEHSPFFEILNVTVPDLYVIDTTTSWDHISTNGYPVTSTGLLGVGAVISNNSKFLNSVGNLELVRAWYENGTAWFIGLYEPNDTYAWFNYTSGHINDTHWYHVNVDGHKPIANITGASEGDSPRINFTGVNVPADSIPDTFRSHSKLSELIVNDTANYTTIDMADHLVIIEAIDCGRPRWDPMDPVVYEQEEAWVDDQLVKYYDLGEAPNSYTIAYHFVDSSGDMLPQDEQWTLLTSVGDGVLEGVDADLGHSPFMRIHNVTVPDGYEPNYINAPTFIDLWNLTVEETDLVMNCPVVPKSSSLVDDPYEEVGPYSAWYNMQEVQLFCFFEDLEDANVLFDPVKDELNFMEAAVFNTTGQRPVIEHDNTTAGYSPIWNVTYLTPGDDFIEDSVRNMTAVGSMIADPGDLVVENGTFHNRPIASSAYAGPVLFDMGPPATVGPMTGWYEGDHVSYYDLGPSDDTYAWFQMFFYENASDDNGTEVDDQALIVNNIPDGIFTEVSGDAGYTGFWRLNKVLVQEGYEANTIKSKLDIVAQGLTLVEEDNVYACGLFPLDTEFPDAPSEVDRVQVWYKDNPVMMACFVGDTGIDQNTIDLDEDVVNTNTMYVFPGEDQDPIFDMIPFDEANYTGLWEVVNVSVPGGHEPDSLRSAAEVEAVLSDTGSGFSSNDMGIHFRPIIGQVDHSDIAPRAKAGPDVTTRQGIPVTFDGGASTDNVGMTQWSWTFIDNGTNVTLDGKVMDYTFHHIDVIEVTLTVMDMEDLTDTDTLTVTVLDGIPPVADAGEDMDALLGDTLIFDASGSSDNVGIVNYTWYLDDGTTRYGILVNHTFVEAGIYNVTLNVSDAEGNWANDLVVVVIEPPNHPPTIDPIPTQEVVEGTTFTYKVIATDEDLGDILTFILEKAPEGMEIDTTTGIITFTPLAVQVGNIFIIIVSVKDERASVNRSFSITVKEAVPETVTVTIGPLKDKDGKKMKNANVTVAYGSDVKDATVDADGNIIIVLPGSWINRTVSVTVTKKDYKTTVFTGSFDEDGLFTPTITYPKFEKKEEVLEPDYNFLVIAVIILVVLALVLVGMRKPDEEEDWEDEMDEEITGDEEE